MVTMPTKLQYEGFETREIKSLSEQDIEELRRGGGWGLALPAELNGQPGPAHLLELQEELNLSKEQVEAISSIIDEMRTAAIVAGEHFIASETALSNAFADSGLSEETLRGLLAESAAACCQSAFNCDPYRRPISPPLRDGTTVGEEPQLDQLAGTIHPFLSMQIIPGCLLQNLAHLTANPGTLDFPSLHEEKEFSQPDGGVKLGRRYPSWRVNVAHFSTIYALAQGNLNTHKAASLLKAFPPAEARRIAGRFEWHYTPKHGSWLNMAECELSVLNRQCLARRIPDKTTLAIEVEAWKTTRNDVGSGCKW